MRDRILIDASNTNISIPGGGSFCVRAYIEAMLALFPNKIDILHPEEAHIRDERYRTIDVPKRKPYHLLADGIKGYLHRGARFLINHLRKNPDTYSMIFYNSGLLAGGTIELVKNTGAKVVILHHNFESEYHIACRSAATLKGRTDRYVRYWERIGYTHAGINLFLTQYDKDIFEKEYGLHTQNHVTGVFEPTEINTYQKLTKRNKTAVITCALGDEQNQASLLHFIKHYLPIFKQVLPDWEIVMMGRNPSKQLLDIANQKEELSVIANPKNINELAAQSSIYLCPMDTGGGLKLRIMDGLRVGQPLLIHQRSARGYEMFIDCPFMKMYNNATSFKLGLSELQHWLHSTPNTQNQITQAYIEHFGFDAGLQRLSNILRLDNLLDI